MGARMGRTFDSLPLEQRLERYRASADRALRHAAETRDPDARAGLLATAASWQALADDIERIRRHLDGVPGTKPANRH